MVLPCLFLTLNDVCFLGLGKLGYTVTRPTENVLLGFVKMVSWGEEGIRKGREVGVDTPWAPWLKCTGGGISALRAGLL